MNRIVNAIAVMAVVFVCTIPATARSQVCISYPNPTLAEQFADANSAVLAKWVDAVPSDGDDPGSTTYEIFQIPRSSFGSLAKGMRITVAKHHPGKEGQLALVLGKGTSANTLTWQVPAETTRRQLTITFFARARQKMPTP